MSPQYSIRALKGLSHLRSIGNDIEIYVEDSNIRNAYNFVVRKFLPTGVKFTGVVPLGDKTRVLAACRNDQLAAKRRRLYLIDGDFDILTGEAIPRLKHLHRLNCYSFENALLNESAILELGRICLPGKNDQEIAATVNWKQNAAKFAKGFGGLFILYAIVQKKLKTDRPPTVSTSVFSLCKRNTEEIFQPCNVRIRAKYRFLSSLLVEKLGAIKFRALRRKYLAKANSLKIGWENIISGKDYLLRFFAHFLEKKTAFRCSDEQLTVLLATFSPTNFNLGLEKKLRALVQQ